MSLITPREPVTRGPSRDRFATTEQARRVSRLSHLLVAAASSTGSRHSVNEDSYSSPASEATVFVVADGVGGGAMAAWASRKVVACLQRTLTRSPLDAGAVRAALLAADREVAHGIARRTSRTGAATVAVCAATDPLFTHWFIGWVGDCRIYRLPGSGAAQSVELLTRDDTYRNLGETPPPGGSADDPARMVGNGAVDAPNVARVQLRGGDALVLCSDGIHKFVSDRQMLDALITDAPLAQRCLRLVEIARGNGSVDDATALVVHRQARAGTMRKLASACVLAVLLTAVTFALASDEEASPPSELASTTPFQLATQGESGS